MEASKRLLCKTLDLLFHQPTEFVAYFREAAAVHNYFPIFAETNSLPYLTFNNRETGREFKSGAFCRIP